MRDHIQKPALSLGQDLGNPGHRIREQCTMPNYTESSGPLRYQHVAPGKKRDGPWVLEPVCHGDDAVVVVGRPVDRRLAENGRRNRQ